jgi:hypothetical protein
MLKNVNDLTSQDFSKGLSTVSNILSLTKDQSPNMMNIKVNFDGSIEKRLGSTTMNSVIIANSGGRAWDFDTSGTLSTNVQAYWKLDEASGTRFDIFGSTHLTDVNNTGQASGIRGAAALMAATNSQYLIRENTSTVSTGDINFSISTWFYLNSTSTTLERTLVSKRDSDVNGDAVFLCHCDGVDASTSFTDNSLSPKTITATGDAQVDTAQFKFGTGSVLLDGNGDYLSVADNAAWDFGTGAFTIEFWARFSTLVGVQGFTQGNSDSDWLNFYLNNTDLEVKFMGDSALEFGPWSPTTSTWYHIALTRDGSGNVRAFADGTQIGGTQTSNTSISAAGAIRIGNSLNTTYMNGWMDDIRISNTAKYTANFTAPTTAFTNPSTASNYEYWLYINTDNIVTFRVSSSGTTHNGEVRATSLGAVGTATWYNIVAWHDTANILGISGNLSVNSATYASGLRAGSAPFVLGSVSNGTGQFFDGRIDETGFWKKVLTAQNRSDLYRSGTGNTFSLGFNNNPWASFDFGAGSNRWLTVAAGTGIYASSDLGVNFVNIATDRTATYQYFERSKNILISTSDAYDRPLFWAGSAGTFMALLNTSAPLAKYCINFQGFTILLNTSTRKRAFYYEDENTHITGDWSDSFDLPSSADDETTTAFVLRGTLYVSTRYALFRMTYVGGNPDWSFRKIKDWGFVPRTAKIITIKDVGEVCTGMSWDRKMRLFDGSDDKIASDNIENDNEMCEFAMNKISFAGSGLVVSFAEHDSNDSSYKLCLAIGANSMNTTHFLNYNGRTQSFFPYDSMTFNTMVMSESANRKFLMAFDRQGYCHMMDSGNLDGGVNPINDNYDSPFLFEKSPSEVSKSQKIDFFLSPTSSGTIRFLDRIDFGSSFKRKEDIILNDTTNKVQIKKSINIPMTQGVYQYRLTSSANTADPWKLNRTDFFLQGLGIGQTK